MTQNANILVIDDEQVICISCQQTLEKEGLNVDCAENGVIGLAKLQDKTYDVVLTDLMMPQISGMEILDAIRKMNQNIVAIVITGYATIESAVEAVKKGAYDYLSKPFTPDELRRVVRKALERRKLLLETEQLRKEREQNLLELAKERSQTATIINCMAEGVIVTNREARLVLINSLAEKMLHIQKNYVIGKPVLQLLNNRELENIIYKTLKVKKSTSTITRRKIIFDKKEGRIYQAVIAPISDDQVHILGLVTILRDISQEKKIEKTKEEFVHTVTHELNAPLGIIQGYLDLILDGKFLNNVDKQNELIKKSRDKASDLTRLIKDLLNIFEIEAGKVAQEMRPTVISTILVDVVDFMKSEAIRKNLTFFTQIPENLPQVMADKKYLNRVFTNLIGNAIKYNKPNGEIKIKVETDDLYVVITIADTGIGIKKQDQNKIFEEFYRVKNEKTRGTPGTGLGLSIAKKIIESHSGYIEMESEWEVGTTFKVYLPKLT